MKAAPSPAHAPACRFIRHVGPTALGLWASATLVACASFGSGGPSAAPGAGHGSETGRHGTAGGVLPPSLAVPPPAAPETPGPLLPEPTRTRLKNGSEVHVLQRPGARLVSLRVALRAPLANAAERRVALWALTSLLRSATQKEEAALEAFGSKPQVILSEVEHGAQIAWSVRPEQLEAALDWLAAKLQSPRLTNFDAVAWQLKRNQIHRLRTEPGYLATYLTTAALPTGGPEQLRLQAPHPALQSPRSFECQRWLLQALRPDQIHVVVLGPLDAARADALVRSSFGDWSTSTKTPATSSTSPLPASKERPRSPSLQLAHAENSAWAHLHFSFAGPDGASGERAWAQLRWGLELLRGSEGLQRVARELRATRPTISATRHGDSWRIHVDVAAPGEKTLELATAVRAELRRLAQAGLSADRIARAVDVERARLRRAWQDQEQLATLLAGFVGAGLDPRLLSEELSPPPGELDAIARRLDASWRWDDVLDELEVTVVGDAKRLEKALSAWRPVLVFDPKRDLRLLRRVAHDPEAPRDISASATEEDTPGP